MAAITGAANNTSTVARPKVFMSDPPFSAWGHPNKRRGLMRRMPSPPAFPQRFEIILLHFKGELLVAGMTPAIAVEAADPLLIVVIDPD